MYSSFNQIKTPDLTLQRQGLFFPVYVLSDGQAEYGKLSYEGFFRRTAIIETADKTYQVNYKSFFSRTINISTNGEIIGTCKMGLFSNANLMMNCGFEAGYKLDSMWKANFVWYTDRFGEIVKLKEAIFTFKKAVNITVDLNAINIEMMPLLCFLGSHLIILRRRNRQAASH